jgi:hypothetical protein
MLDKHPLAAVLATGALVLACAEPQSPDSSLLPPATLSTQRSTQPFGYGWTDGQRTIFVGILFEDLVNFCAGEPFNLGEVHVLEVIRPTGRGEDDQSVKGTTRGRGLNLLVMDTADPPCDALAGVTYYEGVGTGNVVSTDNDVQLSANGVNAFMIRVTGAVQDQQGGEYHVNAFAHHVLATESTLDNFIYQNQLNRIDLEPIGR